MNTVERLKERPWSQLSTQEKTEVKRLGPDQPDIKHLLTTARKFSSDWYDKYDWLTGCPVTLKVYMHAVWAVTEGGVVHQDWH